MKLLKNPIAIFSCKTILMNKLGFRVAYIAKEMEVCSNHDHSPSSLIIILVDEAN